MNHHLSSLENSFIASRRDKLIAELAILASGIDQDADEDRLVQEAARGQANEPEDLAQDLTVSENNRIFEEALRSDFARAATRMP